jgi:hypothetical protein
MVTNRILCATQHIAGPLSVWRASAIISHGQLLWVRLPLTFSAVKSSVRHSCIVQLPVLSNQSAIVRYWVSGSLSSNGDAAPGSRTSGRFLRVALTTTRWSTTLGPVEATPFSPDKSSTFLETFRRPTNKRVVWQSTPLGPGQARGTNIIVI